MATALLFALLCLTLAGFTGAAICSHPQADHARRWDAAFAFAIGASGAELVLLASPLGLMFPKMALLGLAFPLLAGPLWWRSRHGRQRWSWRRWLLQLMPGAALLISTLVVTAGNETALWSAGALPSVALAMSAAVLNLLVCAVRGLQPQYRGQRWSAV
ncbi:MAG: hypothetical protein JNN30_08050 [Rhodanobacteraceae bacterium]|nr:hypothetical protein [Rhodanobacteraceae bacterium]